MKELAALGVKTIGDLNGIPDSVIRKKFGQHGLRLHLLAQGIDDRAVVTGAPAKSVGHEETFPDDVCDSDAACKEVLGLAVRVARRLRRHSCKAKSLTLKVRYSDFTTITRSQQLASPTDDGHELFRHAQGLIKKTDIGSRPVRLLGLQTAIAGTESGFRQQSLFTNTEQQKKEKLNKALDDIADKYGELSIVPGTLLKR